ncbi:MULTISPECIES: FAD/NAD(P)-binding protein [unclassified Arthrobacter]|uniref:FAD/NAD(P)-binding protein n=1 Tax=unclassified Arthrobacter TaxID=235627 RepID=UPI001E321220|nr:MULTISPECIES: FAD/NAD(P)-binding protein [unclassified Arthrobacter]MCC9146700.1 FAD/NAD(P)-binding protein [Arthrobacter sp. zg-Y919]MDK1277931.1 FAD/NAD(P)-binding protein [Arthrobacter sp. zg.Y919]WIB03475.1 FAD/NAD(P)-binding protein [Arthrobacter sp. zg-Y919]
MDHTQSFRVAVIGAGPRGLSVVDRLLTHRRASAQRLPLRIELIDPFNPGPGHVWRTNQSRLFLMNTPALFPTVVPAGNTVRDLLPSVAGLSFNQWRELMNAGTRTADGLSAGDREELAALGAADFPSRPLYGRYLEWTYGQLRAAAAEDGVELVHRRTEALGIIREADGRLVIELEGQQVLAADAAVLALGHLPALLSPEQARLQDAAARHGLTYFPPAVPADVDFSRLPAGEPVLVRGLGLNFFDVMAAATVGRGGRYVSTGLPAGRALRYEPSGREPQLVAASRRGTPYRAKAKLDSYVPRGVHLRWLTRETALALRTDGLLPGFDHDLWPLLHRDAVWAYYSTLARVAPAELNGPADEFSDRLEAALNLPGPEWNAAMELVLDAYVPSARRTNLEALAQPLGRRPFSGAPETDNAVLAYLEADAAGSAAGEDDPLKMAIGALNAGRSLLKAVVADGGLAEASWLSELRGWFEPLVEGLASGPPPERIEQLAALVRAGLVHFVGPDPRFDVDEARGMFTASSPWVGTEYAASTLMEAMMPPNRVDRSVSPLLAGLIRDGLARPKVMMSGDGTPVLTPGLDVTLPPYRVVGVSGEPVENLFVLGLQLSSVQWGTAIAAEAGAPAAEGSRTLQDADGIAAAVLAAATGGSRSPSSHPVSPEAAPAQT